MFPTHPLWWILVGHSTEVKSLQGLRCVCLSVCVCGYADVENDKKNEGLKKLDSFSGGRSEWTDCNEVLAS